jgi:hypothetical protein
MYCRKCGEQNDDTAINCIKCGEVLQQAEVATQNIPNYLVQSILVTLFCCLPLGIPAIVFAAQVNGKVQAGDIKGALASSKNAKMWCWIAFGLGILGLIGYIVLIFIGAVATNLNA